MKRREFGTIIQRGSRPGFYIRFSWDRKRYERFGGPTRPVARRKLTKIQALLQGGVAIERVLADIFGDFHGERVTFAEAVPQYLRYAASHNKATTVERDRKRLAYLSKTAWAQKYLAAIRSDDILRWLGVRRRDGASGPTLNRDLSAISAVFKWAQASGHVEANPVRNVRRFSEKGRGRKIYLTGEEANALIDSCGPVVRPVVLAAIHTGMRKGELIQLRWRAVDLSSRTLQVEAGTEKAGRGRTISLTAPLFRLLLEMKARRPRPQADGSDFVFGKADGTPLTGDGVYRMFCTAKCRCKAIPASKSGLTFHDLRHTAASLMVGAGVPLFDVAKILGHATLAMTMRYAHFAPEAGRAAIAQLEAALGA